MGWGGVDRAVTGGGQQPAETLGAGRERGHHGQRVLVERSLPAQPVQVLAGMSETVQVQHDRPAAPCAQLREHAPPAG